MPFVRAVCVLNGWLTPIDYIIIIIAWTNIIFRRVIYGAIYHSLASVWIRTQMHVCRCHPPTHNSITVNPSWMHCHFERNVWWIPESRIYHTPVVHWTNAKRMQNTYFSSSSSINGDWFRDAVHLVLHVPSSVDRRRALYIYAMYENAYGVMYMQIGQQFTWKIFFRPQIFGNSHARSLNTVRITQETGFSSRLSWTKFAKYFVVS